MKRKGIILAGELLSAENRKQLWIPEGFAHGFVVLSDHAGMLYKTTDYWAQEHERCIIWNDAILGITWPIMGTVAFCQRRARFDIADGRSICLSKRSLTSIC